MEWRLTYHPKHRRCERSANDRCDGDEVCEPHICKRKADTSADRLKRKRDACAELPGWWNVGVWVCVMLVVGETYATMMRMDFWLVLGASECEGRERNV